MNDKFDKMFSDIEWDSDAELTYQTGLKKISLHNKAKYKSEAERVKASERMKKVLQRPDVQEARRIGFENRDYTNIAKANKEKANRPDIVAKLKEHQAKMNTDKEFVENRAQRNKELAQSEDWLKATRSAQLELNGRIVTPTKVYNTLKEGFEDGIDLKRKMEQLPHLYYRDKKGPGKPTVELVYVTHYGEFRHCIDAMNTAIEKGFETQQFKDPNAWYRRMMTKYPDKFSKQKLPKRE